MADMIRHKRSATQGSQPVVGDLELGELAVNTYDGKLFMKKDDGTASVIEIGGAGAGTLAAQVYFAKGSDNSTSIANVEVDVPWSAATINCAAVSHTGAEITVSEDGTYFFDVAVNTDSNNRTELILRTYIDTGAGFVADTDLVAHDYVSRNLDQNLGGTMIHFAIELTAGDKVKLSAEGDSDGTCILQSAGTMLRVMKLEEASGGASVLNDLTDVQGTPTDTQVLTYNATAGYWEPQDAPSGSGGITYSTSVEVDTGDKWIDGRTIWAYVFQQSVSAASTNLGTLPGWSSSTSEVISFSGIIKTAGLALNAFASQSSPFSLPQIAYATDSSGVVTYGNNPYTGDLQIIVKYVK